jgi:hypothetical protein
MGLFIFFVGGVVYFFLGFFYGFFYYLGTISFLRWVRSGGRSFIFGGFFYHFFDKCWWEFFGGGGVFNLVYKTGNFFSVFEKVGLGRLVFFSFFLPFFLF